MMKKKYKVMSLSGLLLITILFISVFAFSGNETEEPDISFQDKSGKIPVDFPSVEKVKASKGDFILCPPELWIKQGFEKGANSVSYIWYGAIMDQPGTNISKVLSLTNSGMYIPNSMIIPIRRGEKVRPGDIILTHWQSGSGMQRAIVVGGDEREPVVRYLDLDYDNPAGVGKKDDKCKVNTFHKIIKEFEPGTSIAVKEGSSYAHYRIICEESGKILALGFAGRIKTFNKKDCIPIPINYFPKKGDKVFALNFMSSFTAGKVVDVDKKIGRIFVEIEWAGKKQISPAAVGQVIKSLP